jgi:sulfur carrier protein
MNTSPHEISFNGRRLNSSAATLQELLEQQGLDLAEAMACAINQTFVPRALWAQRLIEGGDRIDVVSPITGG